MLSGETAKGDYPLEAVRLQHLIAREAEAAIYHLQLYSAIWCLLQATPQKLLPWVLWRPSGAIIVLTKSGRSAHQVARYRPHAPVIAVTHNPQTARQAHL
ncbi:hypothetical protein ACRRTK_009607 [Alexandromys fortis]